jgi:hypothetical protein
MALEGEGRERLVEDLSTALLDMAQAMKAQPAGPDLTPRMLRTLKCFAELGELGDMASQCLRGMKAFAEYCWQRCNETEAQVLRKYIAGFLDHLKKEAGG